jgi:Uma2 family endonuclease
MASAAPTQPTAPAAPRHRLWTVAEFNRLGDLGLFEGRRAMLIHGVILEWGPMNSPHALAGEKTEEVIRAVFGPGWRVRVQKPLILSQEIDPEPDVAVVRGTTPSGGPHPTTAELVIEICDSTLAYDSTTKAELYAAAGIPEYWLLDLNGRQLLVLRDPAPHPVAGHVYRTHLTLGPADTVSPLAAPSASVRVSDLLP